jgi:hypothetical protein
MELICDRDQTLLPDTEGEMSCLSSGNGLMIEHIVVLGHLPGATHQQPAQHNMPQEQQVPVHCQD